MTIITLAVAFAAFCVWLTVRIVNRRERWAICTAIAVSCFMIAAILPLGWFAYHEYAAAPITATAAPVWRATEPPPLYPPDEILGFPMSEAYRLPESWIDRRSTDESELPDR